MLRVYWVSVCIALPSAVILAPAVIQGQMNRALAATVTLGLSTILAAITGYRLCRNGDTRRVFAFSHFGAAIVGSVLFVSVWSIPLAFVPPWPFRDLRPGLLLGVQPGREGARSLPDWDAHQWNSWGVRDLERSLRRPSGVRRILFLGDSFLEGLHCRYPLSLRCESKLRAQGRDKVECMHLGIAATDPVHYYFRLKRVGIHCHPDAVYVFVYAGNDYLPPQQAYARSRELAISNVVAELPLPSLVGTFLPSLNWLIVDRLRLSQRQRNSRLLPLDAENRLFEDFTKQPFEDGIKRIAEHMQRYHHPQRNAAELRTILVRGGQRFWDAFQPRPRDREWLQSYLVNVILQAEFSDAPYPSSLADVRDQEVAPHVDATASWLKATFDRCRDHEVACTVVLIPPGNADPDLREFWSPWPAAAQYAINLRAHRRHLGMAKKLRELEVPFIDLMTVLDGVGGTYRVSDWHWTERGTEIVANRLLSEL
jgi:hypothetical protein